MSVEHTRFSLSTMPLSKKYQRIVSAFLKCKNAEEGKKRRRILLGDCFDVFDFGRSLGAAEARKQIAAKRTLTL